MKNIYIGFQLITQDLLIRRPVSQGGKANLPLQIVSSISFFVIHSEKIRRSVECQG